MHQISTPTENTQLQFDKFVAAVAHNRDMFAHRTSGTRAPIERFGMKMLLEYADEGDTFVPASAAFR
ncbi:hypothetical protein MN0502_33900 (plasmid) [Arthrobacter sp. MN05-02]|nr:hypothetical protein MN0502_33900 [Arthrobacter sp. MN05-02]